MKYALFAAALVGVTVSASANEPLEVTTSGPEGDLAGTLIAPSEGKPVVLIVPGSGPTDRDGNNPLGVNASSYRLLAEELHRIGIGTLRVDKRGMFGSKVAIADPNNVTIADYAEDVEAWVKLARETTGAPCVWVLGHSEGGLVALEAAQEAVNICGLLLVASMGRPFGVILREQLAANPANAPILDQINGSIDSLEAGERVDPSSLHPALMGLFASSIQGYMIDIMARAPGELIGKVDLPILIVAGGKDLQTPHADARALSQGQPAAEAVYIEDMNHILKAVEGNTPAANIATYSNPDLPIHTRLVQAIEAFVIAERP